MSEIKPVIFIFPGENFDNDDPDEPLNLFGYLINELNNRNIKAELEERTGQLDRPTEFKHGIYRHDPKGFFEAIDLAQDHETKLWYVLYRPLGQHLAVPPRSPLETDGPLSTMLWQDWSLEWEERDSNGNPLKRFTFVRPSK